MWSPHDDKWPLRVEKSKNLYTYGHKINQNPTVTRNSAGNET